MKAKLVVSLVALAMGASLAQAAATLKVGDAPPKLKVGKWVQGEPVKEFQKGKAYIVEFWATWCGPCRVSIPHLNDIHNKFKDKGLIVIGQDVWERDETQVKPFIEKMGEKMTYRVALDDKAENEKGAMAETWMEAAGQNGIPAAFLINKDTQIVWIGHPMQLKEETIQKVLDGTFDVKAAAEEQEKDKKKQADLMKLSQQLGRQIQEKDWDKADTTINEIEKLLTPEQRVGLGSARLQVFLGKGDMDAAAKIALKVSDNFKDNAQLQNQLAWQMATHEGVKGAALDAAATIAERASKAAEDKDASILDTVARVKFLQGKKDEALALQKKAVSLAEDEDLKEQLQTTLDSYKKGELPPAE